MELVASPEDPSHLDNCLIVLTSRKLKSIFEKENKNGGCRNNITFATLCSTRKKQEPENDELQSPAAPQPSILVCAGKPPLSD